MSLMKIICLYLCTKAIFILTSHRIIPFRYSFLANLLTIIIDIVESIYFDGTYNEGTCIVGLQPHFFSLCNALEFVLESVVNNVC